MLPLLAPLFLCAPPEPPADDDPDLEVRPELSDSADE